MVRRAAKWLVNRFADRRLFSKLLMVYVITILIPLTALSLLFLQNVRKNILQEYRAEKGQIMQQTGASIDSVLGQADFAAAMLEGSKEYMTFMAKRYSTTADEVYTLLRYIDPVFELLILKNDHIDEIITYRYGMSHINRTRHIIPAEWSEYDVDMLQAMKYGEQITELYREDNQIRLGLLKPLFQNGGTMNIGVCRIGMDITDLLDAVQLQADESIVVYKGEDCLIRTGGGEWNPISGEQLETMNGYRSEKQIDSAGITLVLIWQENVFKRSYMGFLALFLILLLLLTVLYDLILTRLVQPIVQLSKHMNKDAKNGMIHTADIPHHRDEAGELVEAFNRLAIQNMQLTERVSNELLKRQKAEYYALRMQIKPHFVFNVLNRINLLVFQDKKEEANRLIIHFSEFLRYSVHMDADFVTLASEIDHAKNYLSIVQKKGCSGMTVTVDSGVNIHAVYCPQFILQPIVENAVKYNQREELAIRMDIRNSGEQIRICVFNNGIPITAEVLEELERKLAADSTEFLEVKETYKNGIGLINVNTRLRYFYGDGCGIRIQNVPDGVKVILTVKQGGGVRRGDESSDC